MKYLMRMLVALLIVALMGCTSILVHHHPSKHLPPGQAKKITGSKSAKPYAPGQRKKQ